VATNLSNWTTRTSYEVQYRESYSVGEEWAAMRADSECVKLLDSFGRSTLGIVRASPRGRVDLQSETRIEAITLMKKHIKTIRFFYLNPIYHLNILGFYNGLRRGKNKRQKRVRTAERATARLNSKHTAKPVLQKRSPKRKEEPLVGKSDSKIATFNESDFREIDAWLEELDRETA
jgi:hypothetical protein